MREQAPEGSSRQQAQNSTDFSTNRSSPANTSGVSANSVHPEPEKKISMVFHRPA